MNSARDGFRMPPRGAAQAVLVLFAILQSLPAMQAQSDSMNHSVLQTATTRSTDTKSRQFLWPRASGAYPMCEAAVRISSIRGNPFEAAVWGDVELPGGNGEGKDGGRGATVRIPAFFDGDHTWKIRFTPTAPGMHRVVGFCLGEDREQAQPLKFESISPLEFAASGAPPAPGFVKCSEAQFQRFVFDSGAPYFPFGQNLAWVRMADYPEWLGKLAGAGLNWSRVWMAQFAFQGLEAEGGAAATSGTLNLATAKAWDGVVEAADAHGIRLQMVLQYHGQYSTFVNPNWQFNPWNVANGGFLNRAEDFFTNETARRLTQRKYRYIIARWGYSPSIMAWELFNEVEFTDGYLGRELVEVWRSYEKAGKVDAEVIGKATIALTRLAMRGKKSNFTPADIESVLGSIKNGVFPGFDIGFGADAVAAWHNEMAAYLRSTDPFQHLITTSSIPASSPIWESMDYYQLHAYRPDMIEAVSRFSQDISGFNRPVFYGEIGDHRIDDPAKADGRYMRSMLWASLFSGAAGAGQMWAWDVTERLNFYPQYRALRRFIDTARYETRAFKPAKAAFAPLADGETLNPMPKVLAVQDSDAVALWVFQDPGIHTDNPPVFKGRVTLPKMPDGRYKIEWWDTAKGEVIESSEAAFSPEKEASIATPAMRGGMAALITASQSETSDRPNLPSVVGDR